MAAPCGREAARRAGRLLRLARGEDERVSASPRSTDTMGGAGRGRRCAAAGRAARAAAASAFATAKAPLTAAAGSELMLATVSARGTRPTRRPAECRRRRDCAEEQPRGHARQRRGDTVQSEDGLVDVNFVSLPAAGRSGGEGRWTRPPPPLRWLCCARRGGGGGADLAAPTGAAAAAPTASTAAAAGANTRRMARAIAAASDPRRWRRPTTPGAAPPVLAGRRCRGRTRARRGDSPSAGGRATRCCWAPAPWCACARGRWSWRQSWAGRRARGRRRGAAPSPSTSRTCSSTAANAPVTAVSRVDASRPAASMALRAALCTAGAAPRLLRRREAALLRR